MAVANKFKEEITNPYVMNLSVPTDVYLKYVSVYSNKALHHIRDDYKRDMISDCIIHDVSPSKINTTVSFNRFDSLRLLMHNKRLENNITYNDIIKGRIGFTSRLVKGYFTNLGQEIKNGPSTDNFRSMAGIFTVFLSLLGEDVEFKYEDFITKESGRSRLL